jgi:hypothetical protein
MKPIHFVLFLVILCVVTKKLMNKKASLQFEGPVPNLLIIERGYQLFQI